MLERLYIPLVSTRPGFELAATPSSAPPLEVFLDSTSLSPEYCASQGFHHPKIKTTLGEHQHNDARPQLRQVHDANARFQTRPPKDSRYMCYEIGTRLCLQCLGRSR
ncbi:hypothetical protein ACMFMF_011952 [Clarireedia jacksonii]